MLLPIILFSGIREPVVEFLIMFCACLSQKKKKKKFCACRVKLRYSCLGDVS